MLSEESKSQKDKFRIDVTYVEYLEQSIYCGRRLSSSYQEVEVGEGQGMQMLNGYEISILQDERNSGNWNYSSMGTPNSTEVFAYCD